MNYLMGMNERFDAIIVGAGPAGVTAALCLAREGIKVIVLERGEYPGSKNLFGGILYSTILTKLIPDFWKEAPVERYVAKRRFHFLDGTSSLSFEFSTKDFGEPPYNNSFTALRAKFDQWYAQKASEAGALIIPETVVTDLIWQQDKVVGVRTDREKGDIYGDVVIAADGVNSLLSKKAGLRSDFKPNRFTSGVKEVIELPAELIQERFGLEGNEGAAITFVGHPPGLLGGGFIYTNKESLSIGITAYLHSLSENKAHLPDLLEDLKKHPHVKPLIKGGRTREYGAHLIPEAAYEGKIYTNGLLVIGDAASLLNPSPLFLEGSNLAMASGVYAAQAVKMAKEKGDFSGRSLALYARLLERSFVMQDVRRYRKLPDFVTKHPRLITSYPGLFCQSAKELFTVDERPKKEIKASARRKLSQQRSSVKLAWDLYRAYRNLL